MEKKFTAELNEDELENVSGGIGKNPNNPSSNWLQMVNSMNEVSDETPTLKKDE